jgi:ketosteroid isomerase-like protein
VVAFGTYTGIYKSTGRSMKADFAHRWRVSSGKIVSFRRYTDTAKVLEALKA